MHLFNNKKGIVITLITLLLLVSIFSLASVYFDRNKDLQTMIVVTGMGNKLSYIEDDIVSNVYTDLLGVNLSGITRGSTINISFNKALLTPGRKFSTIMNNYETFIEGNYSILQNLNISLTNFNNNFTIEPYNTTIEVQGENLSLYTLLASSNYIQGITVSVDIGAENNSACSTPLDDGASHPEISVAYSYTGGSCINTLQLNPEENNDNAGRQFFLETVNPTGSIEVKSGQISGQSGVFTISAVNITANITHLDLEYSILADRIKIKGGNITIKSVVGDIIKENEILLSQE